MVLNRKPQLKKWNNWTNEKYGKNKEKLNQVVTYKNIPNELEKVILSYMGYLNFYK